MYICKVCLKPIFTENTVWTADREKTHCIGLCWSAVVKGDGIVPPVEYMVDVVPFSDPSVKKEK